MNFEQNGNLMNLKDKLRELEKEFSENGKSTKELATSN